MGTAVETPLGWQLLDALARAGWSIAVVPAFAGEGVLVIAALNGLEVRHTAAAAAAAAPAVFADCARLARVPGSEQLRIV